MKLKTRMLLVTLLSTILIFVLVIGSTIVGSRKLAKNQALEIAQSIARENSQKVSEVLNSALVTANLLTDTFEVMKENNQLNRMQIVQTLKYYLERHPEYNGIWTGWEPNTFDGKDAEYKNTNLHDGTGRFLPYWYRSENGSIEYKVLEGYTTEGAAGDYYLAPIREKKKLLQSLLFIK